jgi:HD domain
MKFGRTGDKEDEAMATQPTLSQRADELEHSQMKALGDRLVTKSLLYRLADGERSLGNGFGIGTGKQLLMGEDPRLPEMPEKPTLIDFFKYRFDPSHQHLLQSANLARKNGLPEKMVLACLLHDIAVSGFIRPDHGYWGAQMIEPYVDEEVSWAIRMHQCLRFFPDETVDYAYPDNYIRMFGADYQVEPYIRRDYEYARDHKWYMSARMICVNDLYSFDPDVVVELGDFEDVIGRHFRQPEEGLGNDNSPSAHMWRTLRRPCNAL